MNIFFRTMVALTLVERRESEANNNIRKKLENVKCQILVVMLRCIFKQNYCIILKSNFRMISGVENYISSKNFSVLFLKNRKINGLTRLTLWLLGKGSITRYLEAWKSYISASLKEKSSSHFPFAMSSP